jgi:fructosamine-3-kinase
VLSHLPDSVRAALRQHMGGTPTRAAALGGGMINQAARVEVGGERCFVKWKADAPPGFFEAEARGLALLSASRSFRFPEVVAYGDSVDGQPAYLILEWIAAAAEIDQRLYAEKFGHALAALHRVTAASFGLDYDNYAGAMPQYNAPAARWPDFYREQRLIPQIEIARRLGHLPHYRQQLLDAALDRVEDVLGASNNLPSLLHGDLWSGNFIITAGSEPALVDPAVYYGDREIEIAFTQLFGGLAFYLDAYNEVYPLDAGYEYRRPMLQLYPMLNHLNHFGEQYGGGVDAICAYYL